MVGLRSDGRIVDSIAPPNLGVDRYLSSLPNFGIGMQYLAREYWFFTRLGHFVGGRSDRYEIHVPHRNGSITRIERDIARVPVSAAERRAYIDQTGRTDIPREKPFFSNVIADDDGRIWVKLHTPGERVPQNELTTGRARGRGAAPPSAERVVFREPILYEVFEPDGRYLGRVQLPDFLYPPAIKGNAVWAATTDANGVPVVTRFRITPPFPDPRG
jgi:hypothetical protein